MISRGLPLRKLNINFNVIGDKGAIALADAMLTKSNKSLKYLNVAWNRIGPAGLARLAEFGMKKKGVYRKRVNVETQFLADGSMPEGASFGGSTSDDGASMAASDIVGSEDGKPHSGQEDGNRVADEL